jgi:addiction module RelE/StbE family toxin
MLSIFHRSFEKFYVKKDEHVQKAFERRFVIFSNNPSHPIPKNHELNGEWSGHRSINVTGNIRAIYRLEGNVAVFVAIGSHSELYE